MSAFWDDHLADLEDPEYAAEFATTSALIGEVDRMVNALTPEEARVIIDAGYDPERILAFLFGEADG